jgi:hypothetical protein
MTDETKTGIGTEDAPSLTASPVVIIDVIVRLAKEGSKAKIVEFTCQHPAQEKPIKLSKMKWDNKSKLEVTGIWWNVDTQGKIQKTSALAEFLRNNAATCLDDMKGKTIQTVKDNENKYIVFKCY